MQRIDSRAEIACSGRCNTKMILTMLVRRVTIGLGAFREKKVAGGKMEIDESMHKEKMCIPCGN